MKEKKLSGDNRTFAVINTIEYNGDGQWQILAVPFDELYDLGFDEDELKAIDSLVVGKMIEGADYSGVYVMRIA